MLELLLTLTTSERQYDDLGEWYDLTWTTPNGAILGVAGRALRAFSTPAWTWRALSPDGHPAMAPIPCCPFRTAEDAIADFRTTLATLAVT